VDMLIVFESCPDTNRIHCQIFVRMLTHVHRYFWVIYVVAERIIIVQQTCNLKAETLFVKAMRIFTVLCTILCTLFRTTVQSYAPFCRIPTLALSQVASRVRNCIIRIVRSFYLFRISTTIENVCTCGWITRATAGLRTSETLPLGAST